MLNVAPEVVAALETIGIDVQYELFLGSNTTTPCISYYEYSNKDDKTGDTFGYSEIEYQISVWSKKVSEITQYAKLVDTTMRNLGFKRINSNEMIQDGLIRRILDYRCLGKEDY